MNLDIIISGSRFGKEREIIIQILRQYTQANVYDCNDYATDIIRESKQAEINAFIRHCDWYVLVASTNTYGQYTFEEWNIITSCIKQKSREQMVTIIRCDNVAQSTKEQQIQDNGKYPFTSFEAKLVEQGISPHNFYVTYTYDKDFKSLQQAITKELDIVVNKNLVLRKYTTPLRCVTAKHVFTNQYRTEKSNGFVENMYLRRNTLDDVLEHNNSFAFIIGAPASGKTRAMYEFLKQRAQIKPEARMLAVNSRNLEETVNCLENYQRWHHTLINGDTQDLSDYYFVCDQVNDMLYTETNIGLFARLYRIAVEQFNAHLLCTSLTESYRDLTEHPKWKEAFTFTSYSEIAIRKLQDEPVEFVSKLERLMTDDDYPSTRSPKREVIGDYIKGLVDYNESIMNAVNNYSKKRKNIIEHFIKAYHTIRIFRRGNIIPLGLLVKVLEQITGIQFNTASVNELLDFFKENNILSVYSTEFDPELPNISDNLFEYDNELLHMRYPACFLIRIDNDYIWNILYEQYAYDREKTEDMEKCMSYYCQAFLQDAPITTLRRIIARSPSVILSMFYGAHPDNVRSFVMAKLKRLCQDDNLWAHNSNDLCLLIAHVLHRSQNLEEFQNDFRMVSTWTKNRFNLTEETVAELMGFTQHRSSVIQKQLKEFLFSNGWDFSSHTGISFYYHSRMIQYLTSFEEVKTYMEEKVLIPIVLEGQYGDEGLIDNNRQTLLRSLLCFCKDTIQLSCILRWAQQLQVKINRDIIYLLNKLIKDSTKLQYPQENALALQILSDFFNHIHINDIGQDLLYYYLIDMACCFQNALTFYQQGENFLVQNPGLNKRAISTMLNRSRPDEFSLIYRYFFNEGKLCKKLPQVSRNLLLKQMNFSDSIALLDLLFNQADEDSTPDVNTLISLLTGLKLDDYAYQNLLQMLCHPRLQGIHYNESVICMMLQYCNGEPQEAYIIEQFIKPNHCQYLVKKYGKAKNKEQLKQEVENYWNSLAYDERIVTARIKNTFNRKFFNIKEYTFTTMNNLLQQKKAIDSSLFNNMLRKLFYLYENNCGKPTIDRHQFDKFRREILSFLEQKTNVIDISTGITRKRIDLLIKDEYFYANFYRIFPEKAIRKDDSKYYVIHDEVMKIPRPFINSRLFSNILQGIIVLLNKDVLRDIEQWFIKNIPDFQWDFYSYRIAKKRLGKNFTTQMEIDSTPATYNENEEFDGRNQIEKNTIDYYKNQQDPQWKFLVVYYAKIRKLKALKGITKNNWIPPITLKEMEIEQIKQVKNAFPDSYPNIGLLHQLFKSRTIPSYLSLQIIEDIFLKAGFPITSSLWKSILEGIKYRIRYNKEEENVYKEITHLKSKYSNLIFEDTTTLVYQLSIFRKDKKSQQKLFKQIKSSAYFLSVLDYSELIRLPNLYTNNFNQYINNMTQYRKLYKIIYHELHITDTFHHFIVRCVNMYSKVKDTIGNEQKMEIIHSLQNITDDTNKKHTTPHSSWLAKTLNMGNNKEAYLNMLKDLKTLDTSSQDFEKLIY